MSQTTMSNAQVIEISTEGNCKLIEAFALNTHHRWQQQ
jgi:hypothetical protein